MSLWSYSVSVHWSAKRSILSNRIITTHKPWNKYTDLDLHCPQKNETTITQAFRPLCINSRAGQVSFCCHSPVYHFLCLPGILTAGGRKLGASHRPQHMDHGTVGWFTEEPAGTEMVMTWRSYMTLKPGFICPWKHHLFTLPSGQMFEFVTPGSKIFSPFSFVKGIFVYNPWISLDISFFAFFFL